MRRFFHAIGAGMSGTALHRVDGGVWNHLQHLFGFFADILHPTMARYLITDITQTFGKFGFQQTIAFASHQIFEWVPHVIFDQLGLGVIRIHQWQFLFEHQGARWHSTQNRITLTGVFCKDRYVDFFVFIYGLQIAQLQFGHAAAFFLGHKFIRNVVVVKYFQQVHTNAGFVVVHIASRINDYLARRFLTVHHFFSFRFGGTRTEFFCRKFRQPSIFVHA